MGFPVILALIPLFGVASAVAITQIKFGKPGDGSVFTIENQGSQAWIVIDGERRAIDTTALSFLGFDVSSENIRAITLDKANLLPLGQPISIELVNAMRLAN